MTVRVNYQTTAVIDVDPEKGFSELCPNELPVAGALE
ncbi:nicotinamidase, partial [Vibrio parahaemolyticus]|nr:nicotinamidase [Vibrio parahaemolyticus]